MDPPGPAAGGLLWRREVLPHRLQRGPPGSSRSSHQSSLQVAVKSPLIITCLMGFCLQKVGWGLQELQDNPMFFLKALAGWEPAIHTNKVTFLRQIPSHKNVTKILNEAPNTSDIKHELLTRREVQTAHKQSLSQESIFSGRLHN